LYQPKDKVKAHKNASLLYAMNIVKKSWSCFWT